MDNDQRVHAYVESLHSVSSHLLDRYLAKKDTADGKLSAGKISELVHELAEAAAWYSDSLCSDPSCYEAKARLILVQLKLGLNEDALAAALELAAEAPDFTFLPLTDQPPRISSLTVLGDAFLFNAYQKEALSAYERAISLLPEEDSYAVGRYAQLLVATGRTAEAVPLLGRFAHLGRFAQLAARLRLAENDSALLPAVSDIRTATSRVMRDAV